MSIPIALPGLNRGSRILLAASALFAFTYGAFGPDLAPDMRSFAKAATVGCLALVALRERGPALLFLALLCGVLGDVFLAFSTASWFRAGLGAFLVGHVLYALLFVTRGGQVRRAVRSPLRVAAAVAVAAAAAAMVRWLAPEAFSLTPALAAYAGGLVVMSVAAFTLPRAHWPAMLGALLFVASSAILMALIFKPGVFAPRPEAAAFAGWSLYWLAQTGLCLGSLGLRRAA